MSKLRAQGDKKSWETNKLYADYFPRIIHEKIRQCYKNCFSTKKNWELGNREETYEEYEKRNREELEKCKKSKKDHEFRGTVSIIIEACAESRDQSKS